MRIPPRTGLAVALNVLVALLLWVPPLARESLDQDEGFSRDVLASTPRWMLYKVRSDRTHPPLYYLLLKPYAAVAGTSPTALRAPSLVAAAGTVALATVAGAVVTGSAAAGGLAGALVAASETQTFYAQQLRSYALYALLVLAMIACLWWTLRAPERRSRWLALAVAIGLATQTHYLAWLYVAAAGAYMLLAADLRRWLPRLILAAVPSLLAFAAWLAVIAEFLRQEGLENIDWIRRPNLRTIVMSAWRTVGFPTHAWTQEVYVPAAVLASCSLLVGGALVWIAVRGQATSSDEARARRHAVLLLAICCALPPLLLLAPSLPPLRRDIFVNRHLLPALAMWAILVATGVSVLARRRPRWAAAAGGMLVVLSLSVTLNTSRHPRRFPHRAASAYVLERSRATDTVVVGDWFNTGWPQRAYLEGRRPIFPMSRVRDSMPSRFWLVTVPLNWNEQRNVRRVDTTGLVRREGVRFHPWPGSPSTVRVELYEYSNRVP